MPYPVDLSPITRANSRVLILGEGAHAARGFKYEVAAFLGDLRNAGYRHFALEMFSTDQNEMLKAYSESGTGETEVFAHLNKYWNHGPNSARHYMDMIAAARNAKFLVSGIDMPLSEYYDKNLPSEHQVRNGHMAKAIGALLKRNDGKVVAFMHIAHASTFGGTGRGESGFKSTGVKELLFTGGYDGPAARPVFVELTGSPVCVGAGRCFADESEVAVQSRKSGKAGQRFLIRRNFNFRSPDYVLHVPQTPDGR